MDSNTSDNSGFAYCNWPREGCNTPGYQHKYLPMTDNIFDALPPDARRILEKEAERRAKKFRDDLLHAKPKTLREKALDYLGRLISGDEGEGDPIRYQAALLIIDRFPESEDGDLDPANCRTSGPDQTGTTKTIMRGNDLMPKKPEDHPYGIPLSESSMQWPAACPLCGDILPTTMKRLCDTCKDSLPCGAYL